MKEGRRRTLKFNRNKVYKKVEVKTKHMYRRKCIEGKER